jgi:hypothetical protein
LSEAWRLRKKMFMQGAKAILGGKIKYMWKIKEI